MFNLESMEKPIKVFIKKTEENASENDEKRKSLDEKIIFTFDIFSIKEDIQLYRDYCNKEYEKYEYDKTNKYPLIQTSKFDSDGDEDIVTTRFHSNKTFDTVFVEEEMITRIKDKISKVLTVHSDFKKYGQPCKFVALLHGPPGTGKSSIVKACLNYCQTFGKVRHIKRVDMSTLKNKDELDQIITNTNTKIIFLEEVDRAEFIHIKEDSCEQIKKYKTKLKQMSKKELQEFILSHKSEFELLSYENAKKIQ